MSNPYYKAMASQFLDLWQNHISSMMADKSFMASLLEVLQAGGQKFDITQANTYATKAAEYWRSAVPSGDDSHALAEFEHRLATLEKRLAALENAVPDAGSGRVRTGRNAKSSRAGADKRNRGRGKTAGKRPAKRR